MRNWLVKIDFISLSEQDKKDDAEHCKKKNNGISGGNLIIEDTR